MTSGAPRLVPLRVPDADRRRHRHRARHRPAEHLGLGQGGRDGAGAPPIPARRTTRSFVTPGNGIAVQWRAAQGGSTGQMHHHRHGSRVPDGGPLHLRRPDLLHRLHVAGRQHLDRDPAAPPRCSTMTGPLLAGIAITSHNQGTASAVTLDTVSVNATELPPPGACPSAWTCADIGTVAPGPGSQTPVRRHLERDRLRERHLGHRRLVPLRLPAARRRRQHQRADRVADQHQRLG